MNNILTEASACLQCKNSRCRQACPIHTNIPEMIRKLRNHEVMDAAQMLFENNPLSIVCSLVCDHEKQCEGACVRGIKGDPVAISDIEQYISNSCFERIQLSMEPENGMRAAVIGAGPAGLTIAVALRQKGYKVTVFEVREKIGGIMRYGIPEYRLPRSILDRYYKKLKALGIQFRPNMAIGGAVSIQDLLDDGYSSVFIGTGAWKPRRLNIPGETFGNVQYAVNYLNNPDVYDLGENVAVIGAGNAAMDAARTAIRKGSRNVTVYVRSNSATASDEEVEYAKIDGVQFVFNKAPVRITDEGVVLADTQKDENGKTVMIEGTENFVKVDTVLVAISQVPQTRLVTRDPDLQLNERGNLKIDDLGSTTMPGVFASGDVVTGAKTVVHAVALSRQIAEEMDRYMKGQAGTAKSSASE
ncbi:NAD(P)-dependent oxidoreductase [Allobaculum mucilyticum]|uniref:NAD(P)-dependent oxidoreductase n=1 Tax=Allobaculum mucilyticum TaxID=2834459 RepID=UPI001E56B61A|nr:NAD(P)-dependent oxidoreductase [Allobaculum mucilyticum]UNT97232.1 NAD(P)-dependent oxidoreductase [Allobaculum mucilyticum]